MSVGAHELAWLARARELAVRGRGLASPNPLVGAVLVRDGVVVAEGWHEGPGLPHAEAMALEAAGSSARGATLVCTLEPCSHHGRTPPCTDAVIAAGVRRVVVGARDPLERERAEGLRVLTDAGVEVAVAEGPAATACRELNAGFLTWALERRPHVTLKLATSLDGKIATAAGESRWISGPEARAWVHRLRADHDAVAVGSGTARADDPELTARDVEGPVRQPLRIVFDTRAELSTQSALARGAPDPPVLLVAGEDADPARREALAAAGVEVEIVAGTWSERLSAAMRLLAERGVQTLLVEGGAGLAGGLLGAGLVDRVTWVLAPMLIGGAGAPSALGDPGVRALACAPRLTDLRVGRLGDDVLVTGRLRALAGADAV